MAHIVAHGGSCCGMRHLRGFSALDTEATIKAQVENCYPANMGGIIEAVLTNAQCNNPRTSHIPEALQKVGFRLVSRFKNPNSGNICNVFHYNQKAPRPFKRLPFKLIEEEKN